MGASVLAVMLLGMCVIWVLVQYVLSLIHICSVYNTLGMSALRITLGFCIPIFFALMLNEIKNAKFKRLVQTLSYMPHFISWAIFGGILLTWLSQSGIINQLMMALGLQDKPVPVSYTHLIQSSTKRICSLFSFINFDFTSSAG